MTDMREKIASIVHKATKNALLDFDVSSDTIENDPQILETDRDTADAIIAALPGMVKPLEWDDVGDKWNTITCGRVQITQSGCFPHWDLSCAAPDFDGYFDSLDSAKAAANAHHRAQIMDALGIAQGGE